MSGMVIHIKIMGDGLLVLILMMGGWVKEKKMELMGGGRSTLIKIIMGAGLEKKKLWVLGC